MPAAAPDSHVPRPAGVGRKRLLKNVEIQRLHLDPANPRLTEEAQGRSEDELLEHLYLHFDLEEIAAPMGVNGYFDEEPLVAVPIGLPARLTPKAGDLEPKGYLDFVETAEFTVVEGNRRLATARILRDDSLRRRLRVRTWPTITAEVRADLEVLPVIIYPTRQEVLPYLGVRHITGNKKWDSYAKARYIASMLSEGHTIEMIEREVGDRSQAVLKNAVAYQMLQQARTELDWDLTRAKEDFSYMLLGLGQREIKLFLGWKKEGGRGGRAKVLSLSEIPLQAPIPDDHLDNLRDFLSWIYGEGTRVLPVIKESRDITNYLSHVVASPNAVAYLRDTRDLKEAFDLIDGEEAMVRRSLGTAIHKFEKVLRIVDQHRISDVNVLADAERCQASVNQVVNRIPAQRWQQT